MCSPSTVPQVKGVSSTITRHRDGEYLDVNDGFVRLTGHTRAEALGKTVPAAKYSPAMELHPMLGDTVQEKDQKRMDDWRI